METYAMYKSIFTKLSKYSTLSILKHIRQLSNTSNAHAYTHTHPEKSTILFSVMSDFHWQWWLFNSEDNAGSMLRF